MESHVTQRRRIFCVRDIGESSILIVLRKGWERLGEVDWQPVANRISARLEGTGRRVVPTSGL